MVFIRLLEGCVRSFCLFLVLTLFCPTSGFAAIVVQVEDVLFDPLTNPRRGSFEVFVHTDEPAPLPLAGFQLRLLVDPPNQGFTFTNVEKPERHSYVFPTQTPIGGAAGPVLNAGDFLNNQGTTPLTDGLGVLKVNFELPDGLLPPSFQVSVSPNPAHSFLSDGIVDHPFAARSGQITIIPEPGSIALTAVSLTLCVFAALVAKSRAHL
jgi:hypothetical protein